MRNLKHLTSVSPQATANTAYEKSLKAEIIGLYIDQQMKKGHSLFNSHQ